MMIDDDLHFGFSGTSLVVLCSHRMAILIIIICILCSQLCASAHHGDNNNWGEFNTVEEVIATAQNRAKVASKTMPDCLGGGIGASSPVWMRDYSQPNDRYVFLCL